MANIILPKVEILEAIEDSTTLIVEQGGEINRYPIAELDIGGGDVTIDLTNANEGEINPVNAETLNGKLENELSVANATNAATLNGKSESELSVSKAINADNATTLNGKLENQLFVAKAVDSDTLEGKTVNSIVDIIYPIGSIYMSINSVSPNTLFGGTWEPIEDTFLLASGSTYAAGTTGGEAEHTLTVDEIPSHNHRQHDLFNSPYVRPMCSPAVSIMGTETTPVTEGTYKVLSGSREHANASETAPGYPIITSDVGGSQAHNNMPPYLAVYMWKRTA